MKRGRGFTLLELIVVLAIFGVFAAMAYGGLNYVLNTRRELETRLDRTAEWQKAFQRLRNDFQLASGRGARDGFGEAQPALRFEEYGQRVEFTRGGWRNPLSLPRPSLERVVYRYDEEERELRRDTWRVLDRADDRVAASLVVLSQIDEVRWRFLDRNREWRERWPEGLTAPGTAGDRPPPRAVELTLKSKDYDEVRWLFRIGVEPSPVAGAGSSGGASGSGSGGSSTGGAGNGSGGGR
ncbi:MAG: type II secretion system minor pseudopilin GspJ [Stagnimonas sp.]|nr:type II secretion system minor pseudopilin GspJ [Stagnimonas sp.]